jgi:heme exporter protein A
MLIIMLKLQNLSFEYPDSIILNNVNFVLHPGAILHLQGINGSGKTTLLKIIAGIMPMDSGDIIYKGSSITNDKNSYQEHISYVGHKLGISSILTIRENYHAYSELYNLSCKFSLDECLDLPFHILSMGQKKRASLLRLTLENKNIWILDEPFVSLDTKFLDFFTQLMLEHIKSGGMIVFSSHQAPSPSLQESILTLIL